MYIMIAQPVRPRRARGSLTAAEVLAAAEAVAERASEPPTVRAVAAELGSSAMALYRYFPTKDDLVDALLDSVLQRVPVPAPGEWRDELRELTIAHSRVLATHPWAIVPLFASPSPGPGATALGERYLAILARGGIVGADGVAAFSGILALIYGGMAFTVGANSRHSDGPERSELDQYTSDANYRRALQFFFDGLRKRTS